MLPTSLGSAPSNTTTHKVVLPFYGYASLSFLVACIMLFFSTPQMHKSYLHPHILAITHVMALGWATMIILGSGHQLIPVLIEGKLYSLKLAYASFFFAAIGIPLLVYGFFVFDMSTPAKWGGRLVLFAFLFFLINTGKSISISKTKNVHAVFIYTAAIWLFLTGFLGLSLVYNFTFTLFPHDSFHYLPLHMHAGVLGWFLLLVMGVGSRLIPMFLISKYQNSKILWWIYGLVNSSLISYILIFYFSSNPAFSLFSGALLFMGIILFIYYCLRSYRERIRKQLDDQMKLSMLSVFMLVIPIIFLLVVISFLLSSSMPENTWITLYGFAIFFGWLTAIILGMTFKTLPFIVWNKVYHHLAGKLKTPNPKDLFHANVFKVIMMCYLIGFLFFVIGILFSYSMIITIASVFLIITAVLYNWNVIILLTHKTLAHEHQNK